MDSTGYRCSFDCFKKILLAPAQHKKLSIITLLLLLFYTCTGKNLKNNQFDYLIFTQRWLPTACIEYMEHGSSSAHYCALPKNFEFWAIHGLWPTQNNHMGPFFCNRSMPFDVRKIQPIEKDLKAYWPNIEGGKSIESLWQHEWEKHGTCAAQIDSLNSEIKYFSTTLEFYKAHNIQDLFKRNNIFPSDTPGMDVSKLFHLIKSDFGKLPQIHCIHEVKKDQAYLSEIRLCYNKNLELMDCENKSMNNFKTKDVANTLTNCPLNSKIVFPNHIHIQLINKLIENTVKADYYTMLVKLLRLVRFLQWVSI